MSDVAITGVGMVTPLGDDPQRVMESMREGQSVLMQSESPTGVTIAGFDATRYAQVRGMRAYSRTTQLGIAAATLAMRDAKLEQGQVPAEDFGLVMASTFGHLDTLLEYDFGLITKGMDRTNPALMPLAIGSAPGAATALAYQLRGSSVTLSSGPVAGFDALSLASRLVASGRLRACMVVGAFSPNADALRATADSGQHASPPKQSRVFDRGSQGVALSESSCALLVEPRALARERGARVHGFVLGHAAGFSAQTASLPGRMADTAVRALQRAEVKASAVSLICSGANGSPWEDEAHAHALCAMFYTSEVKPPLLIAPKASLGESMDASGLLQVALGLSALKSGVAPMIAGLSEPRVAGPRYAMSSTRIEQGALLATASSRTGSTAALVLGTDV